MAPSVVSHPVAVALPRRSVFFAESIHDARFRMAWRRDPFHKLIYVLQGGTSFEKRGPAHQAPLPVGSLVAIPAGVEHRLRDREPAALFLLCLSREFIQGDRATAALWRAGLRAGGRGRPLGPWWRQRMENLWRRAIWEQTNGQPGSAVAVKAAAAQILVHVARLPSGPPEGDAGKRIDSVRHEIAESFFDEWSLNRAAARAELSRRAFSAHFRRQTGQTFLVWLTELRLRHAAHLLRQGHHSIVGAAFSSGYRDLSHFYRLFRRRYRMTPKSWMQGVTSRRPSAA